MRVRQYGTEVHIEIPVYGTAGECMGFAMECHTPVVACAMAEYIRHSVLPAAMLKEVVGHTECHDDRLPKRLLATLKRTLRAFNLTSKKWAELK